MQGDTSDTYIFNLTRLILLSDPGAQGVPVRSGWLPRQHDEADGGLQGNGVHQHLPEVQARLQSTSEYHKTLSETDPIIQGRLHPEMRDPTAPELTHHLCPPLAFLVDACQDLFDEQVGVVTNYSNYSNIQTIQIVTY